MTASKSSPLGDALDLCVRYTTPEALQTLAPQLATLVR